MRLNFDIDAKNTDKNSSSAPKEKVEWVPLHSHPILSAGDVGATYSTTSHTLRNLLTWDGASRLYFWDYNKQCLHRISLRLGEPEPTSVLAASPSKVIRVISVSRLLLLNLLTFSFPSICWREKFTNTLETGLSQVKQ